MIPSNKEQHVYFSVSHSGKFVMDSVPQMPLNQPIISKFSAFLCPICFLTTPGNLKPRLFPHAPWSQPLNPYLAPMIYTISRLEGIHFLFFLFFSFFLRVKMISSPDHVLVSVGAVLATTLLKTLASGVPQRHPSLSQQQFTLLIYTSEKTSLNTADSQIKHQWIITTVSANPHWDFCFHCCFSASSKDSSDLVASWHDLYQLFASSRHASAFSPHCLFTPQQPIAQLSSSCRSHLS